MRSRRRRRCALALAVLAAATVVPPPVHADDDSRLPPPRLERREAWLRLRPSSTWLTAPEIREHLGTGLTTTLLVQVRARDRAGNRTEGAGRADIRYDLWDEIYHVAIGGLDGRVERHVASDFDALLDWWSSREIGVLPRQRLQPNAAWRVKATLSVVPFSQSEQLDAQRWLGRNLVEPGSRSSDELASTEEEGSSALDELFRTLVATSIGRRSLSTYDWTVSVPPPRPGQPKGGV